MVQVSQTRWLSVETSVSRILDQWVELETHFKLARHTERCYTAERLYMIYKDEVLKSYLIFVQPHLVRVQTVNKLFQTDSSKCDLSKMLDDLCFLIETTANIATVPRRDYKPLSSNTIDYVKPNPDLGYAFEKHIKKLKESKLCTDLQEKKLREECIEFIVNLIESLRRRLPANIAVLRNIKYISVAKALRVVKPDLIGIMKEIHLDEATMTSISMQWKNLTLVTWYEKKSTMKFWAEVKAYRDAAGKNPCGELADLAIHLLVLPFSNAEVERVFSQMNLVKTKLRNRMQAKILNAILTIRYSLQRGGRVLS